MSWQKDVADIREHNKRGGTRHIALCYARVVAQIGKKKCAAEVGCSTTTVARYTKTWDALAELGYVDPVQDLGADTEYDFDAIGLTEDIWIEVYEEMRYTRSDGSKRTKSRDRGGAPTSQDMKDAVDEDPVKEAEMREHLAEKDAAEAMEKAKRQHKDKVDEPSMLEALEDWLVADRQHTKALQTLLDETGRLPKDEVSRAFMDSAIAELRSRTLRYLDAIDSRHAGKSMDDELADLLSDGAR